MQCIMLLTFSMRCPHLLTQLIMDMLACLQIVSMIPPFAMWTITMRLDLFAQHILIAITDDDPKVKATNGSISLCVRQVLAIFPLP